MTARSIYSRSELYTPAPWSSMQVDEVREEQRLPYVFLSLPLFPLSTDSLPHADLPSSEAALSHLTALDTAQGWTSTPPSFYANPCQTRRRCSRLSAPAPSQTTFPSLRLSSPHHGASPTLLTFILARPSPPLTHLLSLPPPTSKLLPSSLPFHLSRLQSIPSTAWTVATSSTSSSLSSPPQRQTSWHCSPRPTFFPSPFPTTRLP
jgi:hypothetical protein